MADHFRFDTAGAGRASERMTEAAPSRRPRVGQIPSSRISQERGSRRDAMRPASHRSSASSKQREGKPDKKSAPTWKPSSPEVCDAVLSLYGDRLKPFGRILLKRVRELAAEKKASQARRNGTSDEAEPDVEAVPMIDPKVLRRICENCSILQVEPEDGKEYSVSVIGKPDNFVDVCSPEDPYPETLWQEAEAYFESLQGEDVILPGGRYACAQVLLARKVPFAQDLSLGELCHIVQLAVSQKRILGYWDGSMVPFGRSVDCIKEQCAVWQQPVLFKRTALPSLPLATWDQARNCLWDILDSCSMEGGYPGVITLSNVKRLFRSKFNLELSETALGHSRLNELLQDPRMSDICRMEVQGKSQVVVQHVASQPSGPPCPCPWPAAASMPSMMGGMAGMAGMVAAIQPPPPPPTHFPAAEAWLLQAAAAAAGSADLPPPAWTPGAVASPSAYPSLLMATQMPMSIPSVVGAGMAPDTEVSGDHQYNRRVAAVAAAAAGGGQGGQGGCGCSEVVGQVMGAAVAPSSSSSSSCSTTDEDTRSLGRADYRALLHGYAKKLINEGFTAQQAYETLLHLTLQVREGTVSMNQALSQAQAGRAGTRGAHPPASSSAINRSEASHRRICMPTISENPFGMSEESPDAASDFAFAAKTKGGAAAAAAAEGDSLFGSNPFLSSAPRQSCHVPQWSFSLGS